MPANVMHLIWALTPGGAERVAADLARMTDERYRISIACLQTLGSLGEELCASGFRVFCLHKRPGLDLVLPFRLAALLRQEHIAILHAHMFSAVFWGRLAACLARLPAILQHEHSTHTLESSMRLLSDRSLGWASRRIVAVSQDLADRFYQAGYPAARLTVIPNGIDVEHFAPPAGRRAAARQRLGLHADATAAVIVGALEPRKCHDLLLQAWECLCRHWQGPPPVLLIAGDGPLRRELEAQARALSCGSSIKFLGEVADVRPALWASDLYISASRTEGTSLAMLEAMAAGVPIVATAVGGTPEILAYGKAGILLPPQDAAALAHAISVCLRDRSAAQERCAEALRRVRAHYSLATMRAAFAALYEEILLAGDAPC